MSEPTEKEVVSTKRKKLAVIDGKSVFYRGYYAMPNLATKDGKPTGGVFGFATIVDAQPLARAMAIAAEIANRNPHAQRAAKRLFGQYLHASVDDILMAESIEQQALMGSKNQVEAVMSQMGQRQSEFVDP